MPTAPVAALSLVAGFAVAEATGVRAIGGVVLIVALVWLVLRWRASAGPAAAVALLVLYLVAFAASHVLGRAIGAWPAVFTVAAVVGAGAWVAADAPRARTRPA